MPGLAPTLVVSIGGADAGNYNFSIPASALADILKKSVTIVVEGMTRPMTGTGTLPAG